MRALAAGKRVSWPALGWGALLALSAIVLAAWVFARIYRHAVRTGLLARRRDGELKSALQLVH